MLRRGSSFMTRFRRDSNSYSHWRRTCRCWEDRCNSWARKSKNARGELDLSQATTPTCTQQCPTNIPKTTSTIEDNIPIMTSTTSPINKPRIKRSYTIPLPVINLVMDSNNFSINLLRWREPSTLERTLHLSKASLLKNKTVQPRTTCPPQFPQSRTKTSICARKLQNYRNRTNSSNKTRVNKPKSHKI